MYTQLLEEAVAELQGKGVAEEVAPEINLKVSQYLPEEYIADTRLRLGLYKRLAGAADDDEIDAITDEMEDRFGALPELVENLIAVMRLKVSLKRLKATELVQKGRKLYLRLAPPAPDKDTGAGADPRVTDKAFALFKEKPRTYAVTPDSRLVMTMEPEESVLVQAKYLLKELLDAC
jgi:transcription-repair coupling factor (superfamily II helicase)